MKNIPKLIYDVEQGNEVAYGKNLSFIHDRAAFTQEALSWIDVMADIVKGTTGQTDLRTYTYGGDYRSILLKSYGMEKILNMCLDKDIVLDGVRRKVVDENPRLVLHIVPQLDKGPFYRWSRPPISRDTAIFLRWWRTRYAGAARIFIIRYGPLLRRWAPMGNSGTEGRTPFI